MSSRKLILGASEAAAISSSPMTCESLTTQTPPPTRASLHAWAASSLPSSIARCGWEIGIAALHFFLEMHAHPRHQFQVPDYGFRNRRGYGLTIGVESLQGGQ